MVDSSEINKMAQFMKALGNNPDVLFEGKAAPESNSISAARVSVGADDVEQMNKFKFLVDGFVNGTNNIISEAPMDRMLRESLAMEKTNTGVKIGNWEIIVKESGKKKSKTYDVIHTETGECIASELRLYEAARGLARALNDGKHINSKPVFELLRLEQDYTSAVNEMILYKHHLKNKPNSLRAGLYETRFEEAKYKAVYAREKLVTLAERL